MSEMPEQRRSKVGWENVGNVGAMVEQYGMGKCQSNGGAIWDGKMSEMSEQYGMGKCRKCQSNGRARWDGKMSEMSEQSWSKVDWENVGAELEQGGKENGI